MQHFFLLEAIYKLYSCGLILDAEAEDADTEVERNDANIQI